MFTVLAVVDVSPNRSDPTGAFDHVRALLQAGDIRFAQMEIVLSDRGENVPRYMHPSIVRTHPRAARAIAGGGFQVMSFASNHALSFGQEAFLDTIEHLTREGITVSRIRRVTFVPLEINRQNEPEPLPERDPRNEEVRRYVEWACREQGLNAQLARRGDEIEVVL